MRRKRTKNKEIILEGVYDFYDAQEGTDKDTIANKILNYYIDKIRKDGKDSLTKEETKIFNDAKDGRLVLVKPIYQRNKVTGDIDLDNMGNPIRLDKDTLIPGVPFITNKGMGGKKRNLVNGRCYWNVDVPYRTFYVYDIMSKSDNNPHGLIIWKTVSKDGKEFGAFIIPKSEANMSEKQLWDTLNGKFDKGIILDKDTFAKFIEFDKLYHESKKANMERITALYSILKIYR